MTQTPKTKQTFFLITSMEGGGAERQLSYIYQLPEVDKLICVEPGNDYGIDEHKFVVLNQVQAKGAPLRKLSQIYHSVMALKRLGIGPHTHLICFLQLPMIIGMLCKLLTGCKISLSIRQSLFGYYQVRKSRNLPLPLQRFLLNRADYVIPNSMSTAHQLKGFLAHPSRIIPIINGFDTEQILKRSSEEQSLFNELLKFPCLLTVGRLSIEKGQIHLIRIFHQFKQKKESQDYKLLLVGTGPLLDHLVSLSESLNLKTLVYQQQASIDTGYDVYFLGFQPNPYFFYWNARLFLFPSLSEGLPNALIESFICGLPAISADCNSGPREIMFPEMPEGAPIEIPEKSDLGYLMPPFTLEESEGHAAAKEQQWVDAIEDTLNRIPTQTEQIAMAMASIRQRYALNEVLKKWSAFIQQH